VNADVSCSNNEPPCIIPSEGCGATEGMMDCGQFSACDNSVLQAVYEHSCNLICKPDEATCGRGFYRIWPDANMPYRELTDSVCCDASRQCVRIAGRQCDTTVCLPKSRPSSCTQCVRSIACKDVTSTHDSVVGQRRVVVCTCTKGYGGAFCDTII
jgi:hypothetical protein